MKGSKTRPDSSITRSTYLIATILLVLAAPAAAQREGTAASGSAAFKPSLHWPTVDTSLVPQLSLPTVGSDAVSSFLSPVTGSVVGQQRPQAIEYSDSYYTRLTIHRIGSYAMLPLFAGEYVLGKRLYDGGNVASWVRPWHGYLASGIGVLFAVNTVTGVWNLVEGWKEPEGRTRRVLHSALMLAADVGFLYTASLAPEREDDGEFEGGREFESEGNPTRHRNAALVSISLSTVSAVMMWLWKD